MGCMNAFGSGYLMVINLMTAISGICILGFGIYTTIESHNVASIAGFDSGLSQTSAYGLIALGVLVALVSLVGFFGAKKDSKPLLCCYLFFMVIFVILQITAAIGFFVYMGYFDDVSVGNSAQLTDSAQVQINDVQIAFYSECCEEPYSLNDTSAVFQCGTGPCTEVCGCYKTDTFKTVSDGIQGNDKDACDVLKQVTVNGHPLVGAPSTGGCGAGNPKAFQEDIAAAFREYATPLTIAVIVVAVLELLAVIFGCCIFCSNEQAKKKKAQQQNHNKDAGQLTGTAPVTSHNGTQYV